MQDSIFQPTLMRILKELARNNNRTWFHENKSRYETHVREPALRFIREFQPQLKKISPCFLASDQRVGGSLMRVYRDTRFSKDKSPYKTNVGIHFRHEFAKDVHAPGFYLHLAPEGCFLGVGIWQPDAATLVRIREAIVNDSEKWKRVRNDKKFRAVFDLAGESLKSAPRGFPMDHPMVEDLKRKDFIAVRNLAEKDIMNETLIVDVKSCLLASRPYMQFLCKALSLPY